MVLGVDLGFWWIGFGFTLLWILEKVDIGEKVFLEGFKMGF